MTVKTRTASDSFIIPVQGALFEVSPLSVKEKTKLFRKYTKVRWERGQRFEDMNDSAASCELFIATVRNWGEELKNIYVDGFPGSLWNDNMDVVDENDNPIPCTQETKRNFFQRNVILANEIIETAEEAIISIVEQEEKNLPPGEDGISPQDAQT